MLFAVGLDGEFVPAGKITDPVFLLVETVAGELRQVAPEVKIVGIVPVFHAFEKPEMWCLSRIFVL